MAASSPRRALPVRRPVGRGRAVEGGSQGSPAKPAAPAADLIAATTDLPGSEGADALTIYLRQVRRTELFTPEE